MKKEQEEICLAYIQKMMFAVDKREFESVVMIEPLKENSVELKKIIEEIKEFFEEEAKNSRKLLNKLMKYYVLNSSISDSQE